MPSQRVEAARSRSRWLGSVALLALAPKCVLCLAAYTGVAVAWGARFGIQEICGSSTSAGENALGWLALLGAILGVSVARRSAIHPE